MDTITSDSDSEVDALHHLAVLSRALVNSPNRLEDFLDLEMSEMLDMSEEEEEEYIPATFQPWQILKAHSR